jgi:hypothetical protein
MGDPATFSFLTTATKPTIRADFRAGDGVSIAGGVFAPDGDLRRGQEFIRS